MAQDSFLFFENKGQWDKDEILFDGNIAGGKIFLTPQAMVYNFHDVEAVSHNHLHGDEAILRSEHMVNMHGLRLNFRMGDPEVVAREKVEKTNYNFIRNGRSTNVEVYQEVEYRFPQGIGLKYYSSGGFVKYDFTVPQGVSTEEIKIVYEGADSLYLLNDDLKIEMSLGTITEKKPFAYQLSDGDTLEVPCFYSVNNDTLSFTFPDSYDNNLDLIIDPLLIFSTYSGSSADNWGNTATFDTLGNLYSGGIVFNDGFPTTIGAYQADFRGSVDIGILKYDSTGTNLIYATYIGGSGTEIPHSLIVNNNNELLIFGTTSSFNFPVTSNAYQQTFGGGSTTVPISGIGFSNGTDIYIAKLSEDGSQLLAATYFGGSGNDGIIEDDHDLTINYGDQFRGDIIVDKDDNIYIASSTPSADFPLQDAFQDTFGGGTTDAVVAKFSPDLSSLLFSTYIGGNRMETAFSIKLDSDNNIYLAGGTNSLNFPTTPNAHQSAKSSLDIDGYLLSISSDSLKIINSTFIGTTNYDQVYFMDIDASNNLYVLGQSSGNIPVTSGLFSEGGGQFIQKFSNDLSTLMWSTRFGSPDNNINISPTAFLVNTCGNIFITGWGGSVNATPYIGGNTRDMPITEDAFQSETDGSDFYLMVLSDDATELLYGTYFGGIGGVGEHVDGGTSRFDKRGIVYHAVCAGCGGTSQFPSTPGVWSETNNSSNCNNAAFKFDLASLRARFTSNRSTGCPPTEIEFYNQSIGGSTNTWLVNGEVFTNLDTLVYTFEDPGTYTVTLIVEDDQTCIGRDQMSRSITIFDPDFDVSGAGTICFGTSQQLTASGGINYAWEPALFLNDSTLANPTASPETTTQFFVKIVDENNCEYVDSLLVEVLPEIIVDFEVRLKPLCEGIPSYDLINKSENVNSFRWLLNGQFYSTEPDEIVTFEEEGMFDLTLSGPGQDCAPDKTINLDIQNLKIPNVFTPNSDGSNDRFTIEGNMPVDLTVVNRWGRIVYAQDNYDNSWDGLKEPSGVYFYTVKLPGDHVCKGWVHLLK